MESIEPREHDADAILRTTDLHGARRVLVAEEDACLLLSVAIGQMRAPELDGLAPRAAAHAAAVSEGMRGFDTDGEHAAGMML